MTWRILALLLAVLPMLALSGASPTAAGTQVIPSKFTDSADGDCDPTNDCSLREAIIEANDTPGPQIIELGAGTYTLTLTSGDDDVGALGDLDITDDISIRGQGPTQTVIDQDLFRVLDIFGPAHVNLMGLTITGATSGGLWAHEDSVLYMQDVHVTGNQGNGYPGGIANHGTATLVNVEVTDNQTSASTGGINNNNGHLHIRSSLIANNTGHTLTGGIRNSGGTTIIENSTISGNHVIGDESRGGGLSSDGGYFDLKHVTITGNTANTEGGGMFLNSSDTVMRNTIIAGNMAPSGADCYTSGSVVFKAPRGNLMQDTSGCTLDGAGTITDDPLLGPLQNNGGVTRTHALSAGSPAIDTAADAFCTPQDQRAVPRPQGDGCDIGAFEVGGIVPDIVWGDVNCDRRVDARDGYHLLMSEAQLLAAPIPTDCTPLGIVLSGGVVQGDVNCTGGVDLDDMMAVLTYAAQVPEPEAPSTCPDVGDIVPG